VAKYDLIILPRIRSGIKESNSTTLVVARSRLPGHLTIVRSLCCKIISGCFRDIPTMRMRNSEPKSYDQGDTLAKWQAHFLDQNVAHDGLPSYGSLP
jgi:hypothetical protein